MDDDYEARKLAAQLFNSVILGSVALNEHILVKLATVFQIEMKDLKPSTFLFTMTHDNQVEVAQQWVVYMGKDMICFLVQHQINKKMFKKGI